MATGYGTTILRWNRQEKQNKNISVLFQLYLKQFFRFKQALNCLFIPFLYLVVIVLYKVRYGVNLRQALRKTDARVESTAWSRRHFEIRVGNGAILFWRIFYITRLFGLEACLSILIEIVDMSNTVRAEKFSEIIIEPARTMGSRL